MIPRLHSRRTALALPIAAALVLAACTADGSPGATNGAGDGASGEPSGSITVVHAWAGAEGEAFQAVVDGFNEDNPGVTVELRQVPFDDLNSQMIQQFSAGTPPDVVSTLPGLIHSLAAQDLLMPLDDVWDGWVDSGEYSEAFRTIASHDGTAYGVFFKGNINGLIWHRTDAMEDLGIEAPSDWDGFIDAVEQVQSGGELEPFAVGASDVWVPTQWSDAFLAKVAGPDAFNGLIDGSVGWDDPAVVDAFTQFSDFVQSYWPDDALDVGFTDANCAWA
ncbi:MAG TPA: extracellular solute-binding protein, partial [Candidatus Limnocylindria bacterium]|nr:extracellular solute-binding protein [Candidatus Limnocylindria bacterium]